MLPNRINPLDIAIATEVERALQSCARRSARSACLCTSEELRRFFMQFSQESIQVQGQLSRLTVEKGWWHPTPAAESAVDEVLAQLQTAICGLGGSFVQDMDPPLS